MPRIKSKQIIVSEPTLPGDIINKEYLESVLILADAPSLSFDISSEVSERLSTDNSLSTEISTESSNRISVDNSLSSDLSSEMSLRLSNYILLSNNIISESSVRISGDNSLSTVISIEISDIISNVILTESSNRISGDTSLSSVISIETSNRISIDNSLSVTLSTEISNRISNNNFVIDINDTIVSSGVTYINFIGDGIRVKSSISGGTHGVNVYVPSDYVISNLTNVLVLSGLTTPRYISYPTSEGNPFKIGDWYTQQRIISDTIRKNEELIYITDDYFSIYDTNTTLKTIIYDANGSTEIVSYQIVMNGLINTTQNNIKYEIIEWSTDIDRYKAKVKITISIQNIIPNGGRFSVKITHDNGLDGSYNYIKNDIFRDSELSLMTINNSIVLSSIDTNPLKILSGIKFLTKGSSLSVGITGINHPNSCSYPTTPQLIIIGTNTSTDIIEVNGEGNIIPNTDYESFDIGTWDRYYNITGTTFTTDNWLISKDNECNWDWDSLISDLNHIKDPYVTVDYYDWDYIGSIKSNDMLILIDTFIDSSDRNTEMFRNETYRLKSNISTWDSTESLSGNTGLQVLCDRLVYPRYNFTYYNNTPYITQFDYSQLNGDRYYYRKFETNGKTTSNGIIEFDDYYYQDSDNNFGELFIDGEVQISLSIDSGISWFSLNSEYIGGRLVNGSGCRIDSTDYSINNGKIQTNAMRFTFGQNGTSKYIIMRIKYTEIAFLMYIGGIQIKDNYWNN